MSTNEPDSAPTLLNLPTELILEVLQYLSDRDFLSFRLTCQRLRNMNPINGTPSLTAEDRFSFLCALERDGNFDSKKPRAICGQCKRLHALGYFPEKELAKTNTQRTCLGSTCAVWTAGISSINHQQLRQKYQTNKSRIDVAIGAFDVVKYVFGKHHSLEADIALLPFPEVQTLPKKEHIAAVLAGMDIPICPHLKFNDPNLVEWYAERCWRINSYTLGVDQSCKCKCCVSREHCYRCKAKNCETRIKFNSNRHRDCTGATPYGYVYLEITRGVGSVAGDYGAAWLSQCIKTPGPDLKEYWLQCRAWRDRVLMGYVESKTVPSMAQWRPHRSSLYSEDAKRYGPWHLGLAARVSRIRPAVPPVHRAPQTRSEVLPAHRAPQIRPEVSPGHRPAHEEHSVDVGDDVDKIKTHRFPSLRLMFARVSKAVKI